MKVLVTKELIEFALECASNRAETAQDEIYLATIEALLRDALEQKHGVWDWRVWAAQCACEERKLVAQPQAEQL
jgi:hypothetical protein